MEIWKFEIEVADLQTIIMPERSQILCVQMQRIVGLQQEVPCIWVMVDPESPKVPKEIETFGTGHNIGKSVGQPLFVRKYIGTYQKIGTTSVFVGHVFERIPVQAYMKITDLNMAEFN